MFLGLLSVSLHARDQGGETLALRLQNHVAVLSADSMEGRGLGTAGKIRAKHYIADQFRSIGLETFGEDHFHHFDLRIGLAWVPGTNVVGYLRGSDPSLRDEYIVLGAHYDHLGYVYRDGERVLFPGADDNASGTAAIIELARFFKTNPGLAGRSIVFIAFDAEESGLLGASKFVEGNGVFNVEQARIMFSLDMIGMYSSNKGLEMTGIGMLEGGEVLAEAVAEAHGVRLRDTSANLAFRTDTRPFGNLGIPAVHVFTGLESPYHKPEDTYDLLDYEGMALITSYMKTLVAELSIVPELNPSPRVARMDHPLALRFSYGPLAHVGSAHHVYPDDFFSANNVFSFSAGLFWQLQVGKRFSFQSEVLYDYNGSKSAAGTYRRHAVTLPAFVGYCLIGDPGGMVRVYPLAGAFYRHTFSGSDGDDGLDLGGLDPEWDWGFNVGFGVDVMMVHVAYTWRRGMTDFSAGAGSERFDNGRFLTVGYRF